VLAGGRNKSSRNAAARETTSMNSKSFA